MRVIETPQEIMKWRSSVANRSIGFVPTMGALHAGHEALLKKARAQNEISVLSIFVNPTQFNDPHDFSKYPKTWESDLELARKTGVDVVFAPSREGIYPDGYRYRVNEDDFSKTLDGAHRPGHFDGVLSVVIKLFNLVRPTKAYFGEKDYQQLHLIQGMVKAFFLEIEIIAVPTVREIDGLAMSSRNARLSVTDRQKAPRIHAILLEAPTAPEAHQALEKEGFKVDYVTDLESRRFVAVFLGDVRLIDNVELKTH